MLSPSKIWNSAKSAIYKNYGENPGTMLVHTGVIGWILSSAAQISAVLLNDKISSEQKVFLIPQEVADAAVNILSFYTFTNGVKYIGSKLTKTAKLRTSNITELLKKNGHILEKGQSRVKGKVYAGDWSFDITKLPNYKTDIAEEFKPFKNGAEVITGLIGSIALNSPNSNDGKVSTPQVKGISMLDYQKIASIKYHSVGSLKI